MLCFIVCVIRKDIRIVPSRIEVAVMIFTSAEIEYNICFLST